jgi:hypothetical protein
MNLRCLKEGAYHTREMQRHRPSSNALRRCLSPTVWPGAYSHGVCALRHATTDPGTRLFAGLRQHPQDDWTGFPPRWNTNRPRPAAHRPSSSALRSGASANGNACTPYSTGITLQTSDAERHNSETRNRLQSLH